jgi:cytidine deaminase
MGDAHIRRVNREYRQMDRATDVLSFPSVNYPKGKTARSCPSRLRAEMDPDSGGAMLGDILLSLDHAREQAAAYGHSLRRELGYLLAHGIFHLFGYDHMLEDERKEMRLMEEKALEMAGITRDEGRAALTDEELLALARLAMERSYSPYSRFKVGACLLAADGRVFQGCNIENASFGISNCAERTALYKAVSEGAMAFTAIAIAAEGAAPYPCGACRQALNEFAPDLRVLVTWGNGAHVEKTTLPELLPHGFGPASLA